MHVAVFFSPWRDRGEERQDPLRKSRGLIRDDALEDRLQVLRRGPVSEVTPFDFEEGDEPADELFPVGQVPLVVLRGSHPQQVPLKRRRGGEVQFGRPVRQPVPGNNFPALVHDETDPGEVLDLIPDGLHRPPCLLERAYKRWRQGREPRRTAKVVVGLIIKGQRDPKPLDLAHIRQAPALLVGLDGTDGESGLFGKRGLAQPLLKAECAQGLCEVRVLCHRLPSQRPPRPNLRILPGERGRCHKTTADHRRGRSVPELAGNESELSDAGVCRGNPYVASRPPTPASVLAGC